jgi:hypothetical protein
MNTNFGGNPARTDLTQQPWFDLIADSFGRWADLGGVTYVYEQEDDGVLQPNLNGQLGVRGDIRIGGYNVDGASGTLAFTYLPTAGSDMVFDTGDAAFFANAANSHRNFRDRTRRRTVARVTTRPRWRQTWERFSPVPRRRSAQPPTFRARPSAQ